MLIIEANYSKKLGLSGYSSHQYSLTLRAEIVDVTWSRTLIYHPHIHYLVPSGGLSPDGRRWVPAKKFLLHHRALGDRCRNLFKAHPGLAGRKPGADGGRTGRLATAADVAGGTSARPAPQRAVRTPVSAVPPKHAAGRFLATRPGPAQAQTTALLPSQPPVVTFVQDDATRSQVVSAPIENPAWKNAQPVLRNGVATLPTRGAGTNSPKAPTNTASSANRTSVAPKTNRKGRPRSD